MNKMKLYYISRTVLALAFAGLLAITGMALWQAALIGAIMLLLFWWAPLSGRYQVDPQRGMLAMGRDERTQAINRQAGLNGFVTLMLAMGGVMIYQSATGIAFPAAPVLSVLLGLGIAAYYVSDAWLRRS